MTAPMKAIYSKGSLKLMEPIALAEGSTVDVIVLSDGQSMVPFRPSLSGKSPAQLLAEIATLPIEGKTDSFSGADHDKILYGKK